MDENNRRPAGSVGARNCVCGCPRCRIDQCKTPYPNRRPEAANQDSGLKEISWQGRSKNGELIDAYYGELAQRRLVV